MPKGGYIPMVSAIFEAVGDAITSFAGVLGNGFSSLLAIFYDSTASTPGLTAVGTLSLIALGMGIVYWAFSLVRGLIKGRG